MGDLKLNKDYPKGYKGSRIPGFEWSAIEQADKKTKEVQEQLYEKIWFLKAVNIDEIVKSWIYYRDHRAHKNK